MRPTDIHQNVNRAVKFHRLGDGVSARLFVGYIRLDNVRNPAFLFNHAFRLLSPVRVVVHQCHFGSLAREQDRGCATVPDLSFFEFMSDRKSFGEEPKTHRPSGTRPRLLSRRLLKSRMQW